MPITAGTATPLRRRLLAWPCLTLLAACALLAPLGAASEATATATMVNSVPPPEVLQQLDLAGAAESSGDLAQADRIFQDLVHAHADEALAWAAYGEFLRFLVHDPIAAHAAFTTALHAAHTSERMRALALKGLGDLAGATGDSEGAIALMRQSLAVCPLADTHRALGVLLLVAHHDEVGAAEQAKLAVAATPNDPLSLLVYAILCERLGHHADGRTAFTQAIAIAGCDETGHADHPVHCCVFYNSACYLAVCKQRAGALAMLGAFFAAPNHLHRSRHEIENDPDLAGMIHDPDFVALLDRNLPIDAAASPAH
jgi:Tfp pilus assembly protein PilF